MKDSTILQLDARQIRLREDTDAPDVLTLPIGWDDLAETFHSPLTVGDIELAIELVEDAIGHPRVNFAPTFRIRSDETLKLLVVATGVASGPRVALNAEAVEALFTRLAKQAAGAVLVDDRLPEEARFAATVVLLRELMHHLRVSTLKIDPSA